MTLERSPTMTGQVGRSPNLQLNAGDNQVHTYLYAGPYDSLQTSSIIS